MSSLVFKLTCGICGCDIHTMIKNEIQAVEMSSGGSKMEPEEEEQERKTEIRERVKVVASAC